MRQVFADIVNAGTRLLVASDVKHEIADNGVLGGGGVKLFRSGNEDLMTLPRGLVNRRVPE